MKASTLVHLSFTLLSVTFVIASGFASLGDNRLFHRGRPRFLDCLIGLLVQAGREHKRP